MRHLQYRNDFLNKKVQISKENLRNNFQSSKLILESVPSVTNDITWGGSLLGRLVNSIIRKATIYTKYAQINKPFAELQAAMDGLVESAALPNDLRKRTSVIKIKALLTQIYNWVISDETVAAKITNLIGTGDEGLVGELIDEVKKMETEDFPERDELIKKLEKFRDLLKDLKDKEDIELVETEEEEMEEIKEEEATRIQFQFYTSVKKLFQSIIGLEEQITNKRVVIEGESTGKTYMLGKHKLTPGENYEYTNPGNKQTMLVKLISTEKELQLGPDGKFSKSIGVLKDGNVFVLPIKCLKCEGDEKEQKKCDVCGGNGKFDTDIEILKGIRLKKISKPFVANYRNLKWIPKKNEKEVSSGSTSGKIISISSLKNENYFYENEMLPTEKRDFESFYFGLFEASLPVDSTSPQVGRTNVAKITKDEKQAVAAWKKVLKVYNQKDVNLKELSAELKEIIKTSTVVPDPEKRKFKYEEFDNSKLILIGKEVIKNEATIGKPFSFTELIKEKLEILTVAKHISLLARTLLAFKDDVGLASSYGLAGDHIKNFIKEYGNLKKLYPDLVEYEKKTGEKIGVSKGKVNVSIKDKNKNESRLGNIHDYDKFRMFEELEDELDEDEKSGGDDRVKDAWNQSFEKGDVDKYVVEQEEVDKLNKESESYLSKEFNIDVERNSTHKDYVMKIVNAFGRAYRLYATDYIPSGRPGGRVSLKTFREYTYIGKGESRGGQWQEGQTPGEGPYAVRLIFNAWEDKVTNMLEDNKYKEILQNAKFVYQGAVEGSGETGGEKGYSKGGEETRREIKVGRSLFDFINEMINPEGGFRAARKKIMKEWFGGVDVIKDDTILEKGEEKKSKYIGKGADGKEGEVSFFPIGHPNFEDSKFGKTAYEFFNKYKNCFFKIKYFEKKKGLYLIGYVYEFKDEKVWIKYNKSEAGNKENIISTYLDGEKDDLKSFKENEKMTFDPNKEVFLAAISRGENIKLRGTNKTKLQVGKVIGSNKVDTVADIELDLESISILVKNKDKINVEKLPVQNPKLLPRDISVLSNVLSSYAKK